jgi:hypothetical protein
VYAARQPVGLPNFTELLIAAPANPHTAIDKLEKKSVALVRSKANPDHWDVYSDVFGGVHGDALVLAENIFVVRQVLLSSREHPVEIRFNGRLRRLKPGEALLIVG